MIDSYMYPKTFMSFGRQYKAALLLVFLILASCESFLEVDLPKSRVVSETVYKSDGTALAAISGVYYQLATNGFASGSYNSINLLSGLSADELVNYYDATAYVEFYQNAITIQNSTNNALWGSCYKAIYAANAIMEGVAGSGSLKKETKTQLEGEARFIRAFCHFYLVNLYGDVYLPYLCRPVKKRIYYGYRYKGKYWLTE